MKHSKLFIDTNIFVEYFEKRKHFESVSTLFDLIEDGKYSGFISVGSFYTIAYIVDQGFKRKGIILPERVDSVRSVLKSVLALVDVEDITSDELLKGINNMAFTDLEDSFQYQTALSHGCDYIITLNVKDFKGVNDSLKICTPEQFLTIANT